MKRSSRIGTPGISGFPKRENIIRKAVQFLETYSRRSTYSSVCNQRRPEKGPARDQHETLHEYKLEFLDV